MFGFIIRRNDKIYIGISKFQIQKNVVLKFKIFFILHSLNLQIFVIHITIPKTQKYRQ